MKGHTVYEAIKNILENKEDRSEDVLTVTVSVIIAGASVMVRKEIGAGTTDVAHCKCFLEGNKDCRMYCMYCC